MSALPFRWVYNCQRQECPNVIEPRFPARIFCAEHSPSPELNFVAFHLRIFQVHAQLAFYLGRAHRVHS